jgi:tetratricopeptide (TPR) repeat protein
MKSPPPLWAVWILAAFCLVQFVRMGRYSIRLRSAAARKTLNLWTVLAAAPIIVAALDAHRVPSLAPAIEGIRQNFLIIFILIIATAEILHKTARLSDIRRLVGVLDASADPSETREAAEELELLQLFDLAIEGHQRVAGMEPDDAKSHVHLAALYGIMRRFREARRSAENALVLDPNAASAHFYLAMANWELGERQSARDSFRRALTIGLPESQRAIALQFEKGGVQA